MSGLLRVARSAPVVLFVIAVPLFLITESVAWAVNDLRLYEHGFDKYNVPAVTGIQREDLVASAHQVRGYFNSTREPLEVRTLVYGEERGLFNQREVLHMRDVKRLVWGVYGVAAAAGLYLLAFGTLGLLRNRASVGPAVCRAVLRGGGLTLAVVALVGLFSLVGFDSLFLFFHRVSFSNDLWVLDPRSDYLLMMFPRGFWFDATLFVALATVGQALALMGLAAGLLLLGGRRGRRKRQPLAQRST